MKKLLDEYGNDLLDENGCVQYEQDKLKTYTVTFKDTFKARGPEDVIKLIEPLKKKEHKKEGK